MNDLFSASPQTRPLAARMRPTRLDEILGQPAIAHDTLAGRRLRAKRLGSVVFYGPPGVGKTSLARAVGIQSAREFRAFHPADTGVAEIRALAKDARTTSILAFVDEAHALNQGFYATLLGHVEEGLFDLILATTANPFHSLPGAMISRSLIIKIEPIPEEAMAALVSRAVEHLRREGTKLALTPAQAASIAARSGGDGRRAINAVEDLSLMADAAGRVADAAVAQAFSGTPLNADRAGDNHYDLASAFQKSLRGSDPDASLYWLARMVATGVKPEFIARRLMVCASEDVGLADNTALVTATNALAAVTHIGYPEARIVLAHAAMHVALAPKSNSAYRGINAAMAAIEEGFLPSVPPYLRDAHYAGAAKLGHSGYRTPHKTQAGWIPDQPYLPGVERGAFYRSDHRDAATFEARAARHWEAVTGEPTPRSATVAGAGEDEPSAT